MMMLKKRDSRWLLLLLLLMVLIPIDLSAQTGNRLARLQEESREYLRSLQVQMESLAQRLEEEQPEDSSRLRTARERIVRALLEDDMKSVTEALESEDYIVALETVRKVRENLELVLAILEKREVNREEVDQRLEDVAQRLQQIGEIADAQRSLRDRTAAAETAQQDAQDLEDVRSAIDEIAAEQGQLDGAEDSTSDQDSTSKAREFSVEAHDIADDISREARRQQGIEAVALRVARIQQDARQDAVETAALGTDDNREETAARQRLAARAREQA
ncbi:MAG TPA: hypothetical protein EYF93_03915, partial [Planctomycetes bacterium]|nr:hypothetical protein [Planctomycetota bacterium]